MIDSRDINDEPKMTDALKPYRQAEGENAGRRFNTLQVHAGQSPDSQTKARAVPIYATASFVFENSKHAKEVCGNETEGYVYSRISNASPAQPQTPFQRQVLTVSAAHG